MRSVCPSVSVIVLGAYILVSAALVLSPGTLYLPSIALLVFALLVLLAAFAPQSVRFDGEPHRGFPFRLMAVAIISYLFFCLFVTGYARYQGILGPHIVGGLLLLGMLLASYAWRPDIRARYRFAGVLLVFFWLGACQIRFSPTPSIDVWHFQQQGSGYLLSGVNPYDALYPRMQAPEYYGAALLKGDQVEGFPYPPLSLLMVLPGYLLGDVRWSLLAAFLGSALLMFLIGRSAHWPSRLHAEMGAFIFLCFPLNLVVLDLAWTEPFVCLVIAYCVWAIVHRRNAFTAIGVAALISVKQFGVIAAIPLVTFRQMQWRTALQSAALALGAALPFLLWSPLSFWRGVILFHVEAPFRPDSLCIPAALFQWAGWRPPVFFGYVVVMGIALLVLVRSRRSLTRAVLASTAILFALFLFHEAAHLNYYWLVAASLMIGFQVDVFESCEEAVLLPHNAVAKAPGND